MPLKYFLFNFYKENVESNQMKTGPYSHFLIIILTFKTMRETTDSEFSSAKSPQETQQLLQE